MRHEVDVDHRGRDVGVAHPGLDGREWDAGRGAAGAEAVTQAVEREAGQFVACLGGGLEDGVSGAGVGTSERGRVGVVAELVREDEIATAGEVLAARDAIQHRRRLVTEGDRPGLAGLRHVLALAGEVAMPNGDALALPVDVAPAEAEQLALTQAGERRQPDRLATIPSASRAICSTVSIE
jgi:hypothetical protein